MKISQRSGVSFPDGITTSHAAQGCQPTQPAKLWWPQGLWALLAGCVAHRGGQEPGDCQLTLQPIRVAEYF